MEVEEKQTPIKEFQLKFHLDQIKTNCPNNPLLIVNGNKKRFLMKRIRIKLKTKKEKTDKTVNEERIKITR